MYLLIKKKDITKKLNSIKTCKNCHSLSISFFVIILSLLIQLIHIPCALSWDRPFNNAANWGGTGLLEIPNARILEDGVVRFGASQAMPFRWYFGGMGILPGLEFTGRLTEITNIPALGPEYGANKDKAFDLKYQILPESREFPALAIGINDFWGTRLFPSEYIVISRQYFPLDITLGIGTRRLKGSPELPLELPVINPFDFDARQEYGFFGGIELALNERINLLAEYNPIKYEIDKPSARGVPEGARYPVNIGLRAKIAPGINMGLSYQRGDTIGLEINIRSRLGEPVLPHRADPPPQVSIDRRPFKDRDRKKMVQDIHDASHEAGFSNVSVYTDGMSLVAEFENNRYLSNQKAVGRILRILLLYSPSDTESISAVVRKRDMPILKVSVKTDHFERYLLGEIHEELFFEKLLDIRVTDHVIEPEIHDYVSNPTINESGYDFQVKPSVNIYWNDPSGFFKFKAGLKPFATAKMWKGAQVYGRFDIPLYSNVSSPISEELPRDVARSDLARYMTKKPVLERLMLHQLFRLSERSFGRLNLGYFESMYAGAGGELLYFPGEGRMAFGIEADWVRKREPEKQFELMDVEKYSVLGNFYYYYPGLDVTFHAQYGRFLEKDTGWMFDISRQYSTGAVLGFFLSFTDTDDMQHYFNRGYNHKGVYLRLPARMFLTRDSAQEYNYSISPWTRDVGAGLFHWQNLYDLAGDLMPRKFEDNLDQIKK